MKQKFSLQKQMGFTLIELLIVITIIGILATWATSVYTSQIQKARDTTRISDLKALQSSVEQVYQDGSTYPAANTFITQVWIYMNNFPKDGKHAQPCNGSSAANTVDCGLAYITSADANGIQLWAYELSTAFENSGNRTSKAQVDNGNDALRWETWLLTNTAAMNTTVAAGGITTENSGACSLAWALAWAASDVKIVINGNPATAGNQCG